MTEPKSGPYRIPIVKKRDVPKNETCHCQACKAKEVVEWVTVATWVREPW